METDIAALEALPTQQEGKALSPECGGITCSNTCNFTGNKPK